MATLLVLLSLLIVYGAPNALDLCNDETVGIKRDPEVISQGSFAREFRQSALWWPYMALLLWASLISLTSVSPFLYFQF